MHEYFGDGPAGKLKLGALCAVLVLVCGGCVDCSGCDPDKPKFEIKGPFVANADGTLTAVNSVEAGKPYVFVVDGGWKDGGKCPDILYWYMQGASSGVPADKTVHPPKTRNVTATRCEIDNESISYTFPAGAPGTRDVTISAQLWIKLPSGSVGGIPPTFAEAGATYGRVFGAKTVTVVTPGSTTPPPTGSPVSFAAAQPFAAGARPVAVEAANLKAPAADEVVVADDEPDPAAQDRLFIFTPNASGSTLTGPQSQALGPGDDPRDIAAADFNADGDQDLAVANFQGGNGSSNDEIQLLDNQGTTGAGDITFGENSVETGPGTVAVAVGNLDRDTDPDLVAANRGSNTVSVAMNSGGTMPGLFEAASNPPSGGTSPADVATGDFNGDGLDDIAVANGGSDNVHVLRNTGPTVGASVPTANFAAPEEVLPAVAGRNPQGVAVGDFDKDGLDDLAVANNGLDTISVLTNESATGATDLTFTASTLPATGADPTGDAPRQLAVGDFNGDGFDDLASANTNSNNASVYVNDGKGVFAGPVHVAMGQLPQSIAAAAINGDARDDLAVANFGASPLPTTGGSLTVALAQASAPRGGADQRSAAVGPPSAGKKATNIKVTGAFSRDKILSFGQSDVDEAGIGHVVNGLVSARLKARAKPKRKLPAGFGTRLVADVVARVDADLYPDADLMPPTVARGLLVGVVKKDPATAVCLRVRMDSREGMERANVLKFVGATGAAAGLRGKGRFDPPTLEDAALPSLSEFGNLALSAKQGKARKLPRQCRALLKKLP